MENYATKKASMKILQPLYVKNYADLLPSLSLDGKQILNILKSITSNKYLQLLHHLLKKHSKARSIIWLQQI